MSVDKGETSSRKRKKTQTVATNNNNLLFKNRFDPLTLKDESMDEDSEIASLEEGKELLL